MITNVSINSVFVKDVDASKRFYVDVFGFAERDDITMDGGYRWCTVVHPNHPELMIHLTVPGPPLSDDLVAATTRALDEGGLPGLGMTVDDCQRTSRSSAARASRSCRSRSNGPTAPRLSAVTTPGTGSCSSSTRPTALTTSPDRMGAPRGQ